MKENVYPRNWKVKSDKKEIEFLNARWEIAATVNQREPLNPDTCSLFDKILRLESGEKNQTKKQRKVVQALVSCLSLMISLSLKGDRQTYGNYSRQAEQLSEHGLRRQDRLRTRNHTSYQNPLLYDCAVVILNLYWSVFGFVKSTLNGLKSQMCDWGLVLSVWEPLNMKDFSILSWGLPKGFTVVSTLFFLSWHSEEVRIYYKMKMFESLYVTATWRHTPGEETSVDIPI